jgi:CBS domain-containing protein
MTPQSLGAATVRDAPVLRDDQDIGSAVETIVASDLPALPVVDANDRLVGIFGEREFITALFPGYVGQLRSAAFVPRSVEHLLQTRATCRREPVAHHMNREEVAVAEDYSDIQVAETFLHHRVLIVPIIDAFRHPTGLITRTDFFRALVDRLRPIT